MKEINEFPDLGRTFAFMKMRFDLQDILQESNTLWATCVQSSLADDNVPMRGICEEIIDSYQDNPKLILAILPERVINEIKQLLNRK